MGDGCHELDVAHALTTHDGARNLNTAFVADDALVADTLVLAAVTLVVLLGAEDLLVEEPVLLGALGAVVDGLGLGHFAVAPRKDALGGREPEGERVPEVRRLAKREARGSAGSNGHILYF